MTFSECQTFSHIPNRRKRVTAAVRVYPWEKAPPGFDEALSPRTDFIGMPCNFSYMHCVVRCAFKYLAQWLANDYDRN